MDIISAARLVLRTVRDEVEFRNVPGLTAEEVAAVVRWADYEHVPVSIRDVAAWYGVPEDAIPNDLDLQRVARPSSTSPNPFVKAPDGMPVTLGIEGQVAKSPISTCHRCGEFLGHGHKCRCTCGSDNPLSPRYDTAHSKSCPAG
jgi:hypothetical protein